MITTLRRLVGAMLAVAALGGGLFAGLQPATAAADGTVHQYFPDRPDLVINGIYGNYVEIKNAGTARAGGFWVMISGSGYRRDYYVPEIAAGNYHWIGDAGLASGVAYGCFGVNLDVFGAVAESNETNNTKGDRSGCLN